MKKYLFVNDLIKWKHETDISNVDRVLWVDSDNFIAFVVNIFKKQCVPELKKIEEILYAIESGLAEKLNEDPWVKILHDDNINEKHKEIRDKAWNIISSIVSYENEPEIYYRNTRRKLILDASKKFNVSDRVIYKYLTKYWQRGMIKNALIPDFENSGGKGKNKIPGEKKLGRPRKNINVVGIGINVDEATKKIFSYCN